MVVPRPGVPVWKSPRFVGPSESSVLPSVIECRSVVRGSRQPRAVFFSYSICSALLSLIIFTMINSSSSADPESADASCVCVCVLT